MLARGNSDRRRARRLALCAVAISAMLGGRAAAVTTVPLGAASGGVAINYNTTGG